MESRTPTFIVSILANRLEKDVANFCFAVRQNLGWLEVTTNEDIARLILRYFNDQANRQLDLDRICQFIKRLDLFTEVSPKIELKRPTDNQADYEQEQYRDKMRQTAGRNREIVKKQKMLGFFGKLLTEERAIQQVAAMKNLDFATAEKFGIAIANKMGIGDIPASEIVNVLHHIQEAKTWAEEEFAEFLLSYRVRKPNFIVNADSTISNIRPETNTSLAQSGGEEMDGSLYWSYLSRENGKFGSHPEFDSYDDESGS